MKIRTSNEIAGKTLYSAKDVFEAFDLNFRGAASLSGVATAKARFKTKVGTAKAMISQYALDEDGVKAVAAKYGKQATTVFGFKIKPSVEAKKVARLEETVGQMKLALSKVIAPGNPTAAKSLQTTGVGVKLIKNDPLQKQARKQVRQHVQQYASKRATELKIPQDSRSIFYDLSFKSLYDAFALSTKNKIDLKAIADEETTRTGTKVSGLQIAEQRGLAIDLLNFALAYYKI